MIKKFTPYILIALIIVQLFAPFTLSILGGKNNSIIKTNVAHADDFDYKKAFSDTSYIRKSSAVVGGDNQDVVYVELEIFLDTGLVTDINDKPDTSEIYSHVEQSGRQVFLNGIWSWANGNSHVFNETCLP